MSVIPPDVIVTPPCPDAGRPVHAYTRPGALSGPTVPAFRSTDQHVAAR